MSTEEEPDAACTPAPVQPSRATAAGDAVNPLVVNAATLFPLTQTAEEILAAHPTPTSPPLPSGELGSTLITPSVPLPPEFSSPHRRRVGQEAARLAVAKSKVVQQIRQGRAGHLPANPAIKTKGSVNTASGDYKPSGGPCARERSSPPLPLSNMMSGRLLRAQKQARARVGKLQHQPQCMQFECK